MKEHWAQASGPNGLDAHSVLLCVQEFLGVGEGGNFTALEKKARLGGGFLTFLWTTSSPSLSLFISRMGMQGAALQVSHVRVKQKEANAMGTRIKVAQGI